MVIFIINLLLTSLNLIGEKRKREYVLLFSKTFNALKFPNFWKSQHQNKESIDLLLEGQSTPGFLENSPFVQV